MKNMEYLGCEMMNLKESIPKCNLLEVSLEKEILKISLNRVDVFNALNPELIQELIDVFSWAANNCAATAHSLVSESGEALPRVIILNGNGKHFCAGADINWMKDSGEASLEENQKDAKRLDELFYGIWSNPCFTIGLIKGVALGGGAGLVACLDHVIAMDGSKIAMSEIKLGILPAVIGPYVYKRLGSAQFRRLAMLGSRINTDEALRIGFIDEIAKDENDLKINCNKIISQILTSAPSAIEQAKLLCKTFDDWNGNMMELRDHTLKTTSVMRGGKEGQEGLGAFIERRDPNWHVNNEE